MKLYICLVFLVLALVSISRGDEGGDKTTAPPDKEPLVLQNDTDVSEPPHTTAASTPMDSLGESTHETTLPTTSSTSPEENTTMTDEPGKWYFTKKDIEQSTIETGGEGRSATAPQLTTPGGATSQSAPVEIQENTSWGYVILVLIIVVAIVLCVILYLLRRVSRTYTFDLQRPSPSHNLSEPIGTFEQVYLDDLDRPTLTDQVNSDEPSTPPTSNGTRLQAEEKSSNGDAPQGEPHVNGLQGAPTSDASPSLDSHADNKTSDHLDSPDLFFDTTKEEQQNENNNNPFTCSNLPFVEINLEEPSWCNQLLSSPQAPSSVLPFSPFSFSSSS